MAADNQKKKKLEKTINTLDQRWGRQSIQRLKDYRLDLAPIPTGFEILDEILGIGGIPSGRISEISGRPSSGCLTLALHIAASFQDQGDLVLFLDLNHCFDPEYASNRGINLGRLVIVRPDDLSQAAVILTDLILGGGKNLFLFEIPPAQPDIQTLSTALDRLIAPLGQSGSILIFISQQPMSSDKRLSQTTVPAMRSLHHYASVRLLVERIDWLYQGKEIKGFRSKVHVLKNKVAPPDKEGVIAIDIHQIHPEGGQRP